MSRLTTEQENAIRTTDCGVVLDAAAGSGKTTVMVERYLRLLERGLSPSQILTVTFTNEAAQQLRQRILKRMRQKETFSADIVDQVQVTGSIGTIHSFCYSVLNEFGSTEGLPPIEEILTASEWGTQFDQAYENWFSSMPPASLRELLELYPYHSLRKTVESFYFLRYQWQERDKEDEPIRELLDKLVSPFVSTLSENLRSSGRYAFDDLEQLTFQIIRKHQKVRKNLAERFKAVMVDEFQDTSPTQLRLLEQFVAPEKLFVVGDPKQSIYRFRGADSALFHQTIDSLGDGEHLQLSQNFRTRSDLLAKINEVSENFFDEKYLPMKAGGDNGGLFSVQRYSGGKTRSEASGVEIETVTNWIKNELAQGKNPSEFALLFRNSDRIVNYQKALQAQGIPTRCRHSQSLFKSRDVLDICNYLRTINNPLDDFYFSAFLCSPYVGFDYKDLWQHRKEKMSSLFESVLRENPTNLRWFFDWVEKGNLNLQATLSTLVSQTSYWPIHEEPVLALLAPLIKEDLLVSEAVERIRAWETQAITFESIDGDTEAVSLMTVHAAKGLEFSSVLLVDLLRMLPRNLPPFLSGKAGIGFRYQNNGENIESKTYEQLKAQNLTDDLAESKRILYVALTRAMDSLTIFLPNETKLFPKDSWAKWLEDSVS